MTSSGIGINRAPPRQVHAGGHSSADDLSSTPEKEEIDGRDAFPRGHDGSPRAVPCPDRGSGSGRRSRRFLSRQDHHAAGRLGRRRRLRFLRPHACQEHGPLHPGQPDADRAEHAGRRRCQDGEPRLQRGGAGRHRARRAAGADPDGAGARPDADPLRRHQAALARQPGEFGRHPVRLARLASEDDRRRQGPDHAARRLGQELGDLPDAGARQRAARHQVQRRAGVYRCARHGERRREG